MKKIVLFASGEGTNAEQIFKYFQHNAQIRVVLVVYNRKQAGVALRAQRWGVETQYMDKETLQKPEIVLPLLRGKGTDFIVLDGFLLLVPEYLLDAFPQRIVNIHPSLIPLHSGKGLYGMRVHEDVLRTGDKESGITIHLIDKEYDRGRILWQETCPVLEGDSPETLAARVHELEYRFYAPTIEEAVLKS